MTIELLGIVIGSLVTIGVAIFQVNKQKQKQSDRRQIESNNEIWKALDNIRYYLEDGMSKEGREIKSFTFKPYIDFREILIKRKSDINLSLYTEISEFFNQFNKDTESKLVSLIKNYHDSDLFPNEKIVIQEETNKNRIDLLNEISEFMKNIKPKLEL